MESINNNALYRKYLAYIKNTAKIKHVFAKLAIVSTLFVQSTIKDYEIN